MVVFKRDVAGGYLVIPEFDIALEVADNTLSIFNGQEILHGVSTIEYEKRPRLPLLHCVLLIGTNVEV